MNITWLFDLISPRACAVCGKRLSPTESVMCAPCHLHLPVTGFERTPLDNAMARLFWLQFPIERAAAWFYYEPHGPVSDMIYDMKYRGRPDIAEALGAIVAQRFSSAGFFDGIDVLVPMPITWRRQWQRGYNQSTMIARGISTVTQLPICTNAVKRTVFRQSQTTRSGMERLHAVDDAFLLAHPDKIANRHILIIDDIVTTGATITACARQAAMAPGVRISILSLGLTKS